MEMNRSRCDEYMKNSNSGVSVRSHSRGGTQNHRSIAEAIMALAESNILIAEQLGRIADNSEKASD